MATYNSFKKINSEAIIDANVPGTAFANNSVTTAKFANASVRTADIANNSVETNQLATSIDFSGKTMTYRAITDSDLSASAGITGAQLASGSTITNLGFTPLNKAGGTVSGQLKIPAGSAASPSLVSSNSSNTGIYFPSDNSIAISTAGGARITINSAGAISNPDLPVFYASGNGGWYYGNSFGGSNGWRELVNGMTWNVQQQGGNNMSTNGRFTAPVAGYYYFYVQTYYYNDQNNSNGYSHWTISKNSGIGVLGGRTPHTIYGHGGPNNHIPGINASMETYMNPGDYACPHPYFGNGAGRFHGDHSLYCGYLIG